MIFGIILAIILGTVIGIITGLLPGVHINLVGTIIVSSSITFFAMINPIFLVVFIVALSITHTFIDFIPSLFLGCPDTTTELSVLPGHQMLKEGKGIEAITITLFGCLIGVIVLIIISFPLVKLFPIIFLTISKVIPFILIAIVGIMILTESQKFKALFVVVLCGTLGILVLNSSIKEPLTPILTGLFGSSMILMSIKEKTKIPKQEDNNFKLEKRKFLKPLFASIFIAPFCGLLPGMSSGQAAVVSSEIAKTDNKGFLFLIGVTNILVMGVSFIGIYAIQKGRTGSAVFVQNLLGQLDKNLLILILGVIFISGIISFFIGKILAKTFLKTIEKLNYTKISIAILIFLWVIVLVLSGIIGFFVFIIATLTGIFCISLGVRRTHMMACLLIPTITLYLF